MCTRRASCTVHWPIAQQVCQFAACHIAPWIHTVYIVHRVATLWTRIYAADLCPIAKHYSCVQGGTAEAVGQPLYPQSVRLSQGWLCVDALSDMLANTAPRSKFLHNRILGRACLLQTPFVVIQHFSTAAMLLLVDRRLRGWVFGYPHKGLQKGISEIEMRGGFGGCVANLLFFKGTPVTVLCSLPRTLPRP